MKAILSSILDKSSHKQRLIFFWGLWIAVVFLLVFWTLWENGYRFNATSSLPKGLYQINQGNLTYGDYATFCLDGDFSTLAKEREYLAEGSCKSGLRPLLKQVVALPDDTIQISAEGIYLNGSLLANSKIKELDSHNRPINSILANGTIPQGKALLLSGAHQGSFDSRYFGLIDVNELQLVKPVLTF